jgi:hypothetical protein
VSGKRRTTAVAAVLRSGGVDSSFASTLHIDHSVPLDNNNESKDQGNGSCSYRTRVSSPPRSVKTVAPPNRENTSAKSPVAAGLYCLHAAAPRTKEIT